ncbi:PAS domain-containing protein [Maribacter sp. CXY002]|uniref:PAS domain-containing protein n=1 Tax=Maribacter luteocoastalis TaxID=3407671 RepID=UPI003B6850AF
MNNLINYENALGHYYKTLALNSLPISSLDFYSQSFENICMIENDMKSISQLAAQNNWKLNSTSIDKHLRDQDHIIVVTNLKLQIVFATKNIWKMNRYRPTEIIGKKPKIFQGNNTCRISLEYISNSIKNNKPFEATIVNYRKDGEPYNCWIKGEPVYNVNGKVVNFIAFEKEVA